VGLIAFGLVNWAAAKVVLREAIVFARQAIPTPDSRQPTADHKTRNAPRDTSV